MNKGISIVITAYNAASRLNQLLSTFFNINTYVPVEVLVLDPDSKDSTSNVLAGYATAGCIRHIVCSPNTTQPSLSNRGVHKARYPFILFLSPDVLFIRDVLPLALDRLEGDMDVGAVSITAQGKDQRLAVSPQTLPGRSTAFLLCSRSDLERLFGLPPAADRHYCDLCQRIQRDLGKRCLDLNEQVFLAFQEPGGIRLNYFPAYTNPYQCLLYQPFPGHFQIQSGSLDDVLTEMCHSLEHRDHVFHLHWSSPVLHNSHSPQDAQDRLHAFVARLDRFCALGGILVWTVHNLQPHESQYPELEKELCRAIVDRSHVVHVHSPRVPELVRSAYEIPLHKLVVAPLGNYMGLYPVSKDKSQARQDLGVPLDAPLFFFVGLIRPYKGLHRLRDAFASCVKKHPQAQLMVAGKVKKMDEREISGLFSGLKNCRLHLGYIPDDQLGNYLQAADYLVLPFEQVLTSSSVILGQSYGLPPIIPNLGLLPDHVQDGQTGYIYDAEDPDGLAKAMIRALDRHEHYPEMSSAALEAARSLSWVHSAAMLAARIGSEVYSAYPCKI